MNGSLVSTCIYEGEYCNYDKKGNVSDYGVPEGGGTVNGWKSTKPNNISLKESLIAAGALMLTAYAGYKVFTWSASSFEDSAAGKWYQDRHEAIMQQQENNRIKKELLKKAEEEERLGNTYNAEKYRREAKNYW